MVYRRAGVMKKEQLLGSEIVNKSRDHVGGSVGVGYGPLCPHLHCIERSAVQVLDIYHSAPLRGTRPPNSFGIYPCGMLREGRLRDVYCPNKCL